jgi:hypothetical protein
MNQLQQGAEKGRRDARRDLILNYSPTRIAAVLAVIAAFLTTLNIAGHGLQYFFGVDRFQHFVRLFNISGEANVAVWYQATTLLCCALLLAFVARSAKALDAQYTRHWRGLALIFLYLSVDELAEIHEMMITPAQKTLQGRGFWYNAWFAPAGILVLLVGCVYLRFLFHLPAATRMLFIVAGGGYLAGAVGFESVGCFLQDYYPEQIIARGTAAMVEEVLEMGGVILFLYALVAHLNHTAINVYPTFGSPMARSPRGRPNLSASITAHPIRPASFRRGFERP